MVSDTSVKDAKGALRTEIRHRRKTRSPADRESAAAGLTANLIAVVRRLSPALVACYLSAADEPDTRPFLRWAAANSVEVLVPLSRPDGRLDWVFSRGGAERPGLFGISELVGDVVADGVFQSADLMLIPAAAVDQSGMRMGWGRGFFDRALASLPKRPPVFAVVFDDELREAVPAEAHDRPVDGVVTPSQTLAFPAPE